MILDQWLSPGMTVIDAGANVGQHTLLASTEVGPRGRVHCFEPHPGVYRALARNLRRAGSANVVAQPLALGGTSGARDLFLPAIGNVGATSFTPRATPSTPPTPLRGAEGPTSLARQRRT